MSQYDFAAQRLYVDEPLTEGAIFALSRDQANYLLKVLRLADRSTILVFNGRDGEWRANIEITGKRDAAIRAVSLERLQTPRAPLQLLFAPIKHARLDYMVQKAVEMGVGRLTPVLTRRTQVHRINLERMRANVIEAAEQCGVMALTDIDEPISLDRLIADWPASKGLIFCDEDAPIEEPVGSLRQWHLANSTSVSVLIGPEGGFDPLERALLSKCSECRAISLGPRILRADTAAVAALAIVQTALGDWRGDLA